MGLQLAADRLTKNRAQICALLVCACSPAARHCRQRTVGRRVPPFLLVFHMDPMFETPNAPRRQGGMPLFRTSGPIIPLDRCRCGRSNAWCCTGNCPTAKQTTHARTRPRSPQRNATFILYFLEARASRLQRFAATLARPLVDVTARIRTISATPEWPPNHESWNRRAS